MDVFAFSAIKGCKIAHVSAFIVIKPFVCLSSFWVTVHAVQLTGSLLISVGFSAHEANSLNLDRLAEHGIFCLLKSQLCWRAHIGATLVIWTTMPVKARGSQVLGLLLSKWLSGLFVTQASLHQKEQITGLCNGRLHDGKCIKVAYAMHACIHKISHNILFCVYIHITVILITINTEFYYVHQYKLISEQLTTCFHDVHVLYGFFTIS